MESSTSILEASRLIGFQLGTQVDYKGRHISNLWKLDHFWLENDRQYIQWLFPIETKNKLNHHAPKLTQEELLVIASNHQFHEAQQKSLDLMLDFFGMQRDKLTIKPLASLDIHKNLWLKSINHNHEVIYLMIRSLTLCNQKQLALVFRDAMIKAASTHGKVSQDSVNHWLEADKI